MIALIIKMEIIVEQKGENNSPEAELSPKTRRKIQREKRAMLLKDRLQKVTEKDVQIEQASTVK